MDILLPLLAVLLISVCGVLLLLLCVPVHLDLWIAKDVRWRTHMALHLLGKNGPRILLVDSSFRGGKPPPKPRPRKRPSAIRSIPARAFLRFVADVLRRVRFRTLMVRGEFGCDDPALTGQIFGTHAPLVHGLRHIANVDAHVIPDFGQARLEGRAEVAVSLVPITLTGPVVRLAWHILRQPR